MKYCISVASDDGGSNAPGHGRGRREEAAHAAAHGAPRHLPSCVAAGDWHALRDCGAPSARRNAQASVVHDFFLMPLHFDVRLFLPTFALCTHFGSRNGWSPSILRKQADTMPSHASRHSGAIKQEKLDTVAVSACASFLDAICVLRDDRVALIFTERVTQEREVVDRADGGIWVDMGGGTAANLEMARSSRLRGDPATAHFCASQPSQRHSRVSRMRISAAWASLRIVLHRVRRSLVG
eukprot:6191158-Pleurochrysis_carterae.AAC.2